MGMKHTYIFTGHLTAEQPLATCSADLLAREGEGSMSPIPVPSTRTANGKVLYFPATGIRGAIRRAGLAAIRSLLIQHTGNPTPFTLDEHYLLSSGGLKGKEKENRISVAVEETLLAKNPHLAVFGASAAGVLGFVQGLLNMGNAFAEPGVEPAVFSGARVDEFYHKTSEVKYLSTSDVESLVARARGNRDRSEVDAELKLVKADIKALKKNGGSAEQAAALNAKLAELEQQREEIKESTGASDVGLGRPLAGYKAIPLGSVLSHRMHLFRASEAEFGLLLAALHRFALHEPTLGAHTATGCGLVSGEWEVIRLDEEGARESLGLLLMEPFIGLEGAHQAFDQARAAFSAFVVGDQADFGIPSIGKE